MENLFNIPECNDNNIYGSVPPITFTVNGIQKQLSTLNINKASGPDNISGRILQICATEIAPILTVLFSQSLNTGEVPLDWLSANVTPVYKKGDKHNPSNYRPISLTSICCKIMEHILYHTIMKHLETNNILSDFQYGFRPAHSCETQLISLVEEIQQSLDSHYHADLIMLDFSKAFDTVPHTRLLKKLQHYGINGKLHKWLATWLTNRTQRVVVNGYTSDHSNVRSGVPQGTVLGPLLFLLYINDIGYNISSGLRLFADDCILYRTIKCDNDKWELQNDLDKVTRWANTWQMSFNVNKCAVLHCTRSLSPSPSTYLLDGHPLTNVCEHSYLGIMFDSKMSFSSHINNITAKATKILNFLRRNLYKCSKTTKAKAYLALIRPILEYSSTVWDPHLIKNINTIEKVQRRAARWVMSDYSQSSVTSMLDELQWSTLHKRRYISRLQMFYKIIYHHLALEVPPYFISTQRPTRYQHTLHYIIPFANTDSYKHSFFLHTIRDWNNLPIELIETGSLESFKSNLCNYLTI